VEVEAPPEPVVVVVNVPPPQPTAPVVVVIPIPGTTHTCTPHDVEPIADAGPDQDTALNAKVALNGSASTVDSTAYPRFDWFFISVPAGSFAVLLTPNVVNPSFYGDQEGDYVLGLVVNDGCTISAHDTVTIRVRNRAPIANAGLDREATKKSIVSIDGRASADPEKAPLTYSWSFVSRPEGSTAAILNPAAAYTSFFPDRSGTYLLQLVVHDGVQASAADTVTIQANNTVPVAQPGTTLYAEAGTEVQFQGAGTDANGDELSFRWRIVSSPAGAVVTLADAETPSPSFSGDLAGEYRVGLIVNDGEADSAEVEAPVIVSPALPRLAYRVLDA
jgi:hypothetical protein